MTGRGQTHDERCACREYVNGWCIDCGQRELSSGRSRTSDEEDGVSVVSRCGVCAECKAGATCTATLRLAGIDPAELAARVEAALGFLDRMLGVDVHADALIVRVQRLLTEPCR